MFVDGKGAGTHSGFFSIPSFPSSRPPSRPSSLIPSLPSSPLLPAILGIVFHYQSDNAKYQ